MAVELYRYHFLPIISIPRVADYWNSRYWLCGRYWGRNFFITITDYYLSIKISDDRFYSSTNNLQMTFLVFYTEKFTYFPMIILSIGGADYSYRYRL